MALYTIGDLHLSLGADKPMDVFGGDWENYTEKLRENFSALSSEDVTVLCGDLSWGMDLRQALPDFKFIDALPGRKIILKGNHDFWWTTASKAYRVFAESYGITAPITLDDFSLLLSTRIATETKESLASFFDVPKELADRIYSFRDEFMTFTELIEAIEHKQFTCVEVTGR